MVDLLALSLCHGLLVIAAFRLVARDELDVEGEPRRLFGWRRRPPLAQGESALESSEQPESERS